MRKQQMELSFNSAPQSFRSPFRRQRKTRRAHWWFEQMRQLVDRAIDHEPRPLPRPEQVYLNLPGRSASCGPRKENA